MDFGWQAIGSEYQGREETDRSGNRLATLDGVHADDLERFRRLAGPPRRVKRGETLRLQGDSLPQFYLLTEGWLACSITATDGRRQIVKLHLPGDLAGMPSLGSAHACDTIHALTDAIVGTVEVAAIGRLFSEDPRLAALLFLMAQEERVALMDQIVSIGRTDARTRISALILRLYTRLFDHAPADGDRFVLPLTQEEVGDMTGLTPVHVNRMLRELRLARVMTWQQGMVHILDAAALVHHASLPPRPKRDTSWLPARFGGSH